MSTQQQCVEGGTGGDIGEDGPTCAGGRAGGWSCAVAVEEADLSVETPKRAVGGVSTKALAFG